MQYLSLLLAFSGLALGQYGNPPKQKHTPATTKSTPKPTHSASSSSGGSSSGIHVIKVGDGGLKFTPDSITAKVGDQVEFEFVGTGHSVVQGVFNNPCQPAGPSAFFSGFPNPGGPPFTITVNSTSPTFFYCSQVGHCQAGMVGVINPPAGETVQDYAKAAANTKTSKAPSTNPQGGVFAKAKAKPASGGKPASSGTGSASAGTASPGAAAGQFVLGTLGMIGLTVPLGIAAYGGF